MAGCNLPFIGPFWNFDTNLASFFKDCAIIHIRPILMKPLLLKQVTNNLEESIMKDGKANLKCFEIMLSIHQGILEQDMPIVVSFRIKRHKDQQALKLAGPPQTIGPEILHRDCMFTSFSLIR